ncbi:37510_t:CDS:2, partial [Gigaspora margarita]
SLFNKNWMNQLIKQNNFQVKITYSNRSIFVRNTVQLSILPNHKLIEDAYKDHNSVYVKLQVPEVTIDINKQSLVPLIPVLTLQELLEKESNSSSENKDENDSNSDDEIQESKTKNQKFQELIQSFISKERLESNLVAATGLTGGVNCEEWSTMLCFCGITCQNRKSQYFQKQEKIFNRIKTAAKKSANNALCARGYCKKNRYFGSSKVTSTLYEYNITLDVGVDSDLNTNKTLYKEKIVHKIFTDLKHKSKILKNKI